MTRLATRQQHARVGRNYGENNHIVQRDPALINLGVPLPSLPLLSNLITPLVAGNNQQPPTTAPVPTPPLPTVPATTPGNSGNGGGDGNGGNNGSSSGSSGGNGSNGNGNGSSGNGSNGNGNENGGHNGSGNGTGPGGENNGSSTTPSQSPNQGASTDVPSKPSTVSNGASSVADSSSPASTNSSSSSVLTDSSSDVSDNADGSSNNSDNGSEFGTATGIHGAIGGIATSTSTPGSTTPSFSNGGASRTQPAPTVGSTSDAENHSEPSSAAKTGGLSGGAIAAIVVLILLFLISMVVVRIIVVRRRLRARRAERQNHWWFSRKRNSDNLDNGIEEKIPNRRSVRSSFETTFDRSQTPRLDLNFDIPPLPPLAEVRGEPLLINIDTPKVTVQKPNETSRFSVGSVSSTGSDGQTQYLYVNNSQSMKPELGTPMSVRPFSPTESFAFPKPPAETNSGDWSSQISRPLSVHTVATRSLRSPTIEVPPTPINPFADPFPSSSTNPFADPLPPVPKSPSAVNPKFFEIETIRRAFVPNLADELPVVFGDKVKILQMFDDGWALVEKNPIIDDPKGNGPGIERQPETGLIPIDCFRDAGVDLSEFIATKRVSSYSQTSGTNNPGIAF